MEIQDGGVISLFENKTNEQFVKQPSEKICLSGLYRLNAKPLLMSSGRSVTKADRSGSITQSSEWLNDAGKPYASCITKFSSDTESSDIIVTQKGHVDSKGLYGISWGISNIPDSLSVLVPGESGQRLGSDAPQGIRSFDYPFGWEAPFVVIQGINSGVIIRAEDTAYHFKSLFVEHTGHNFQIRFESRNMAPFENKDSIQSVRWYITAYKGPWQTGAAIYSSWAKKYYHLKPVRERNPAWARDIQFAVLTGSVDMSALELLSKQVDPKKTIIYFSDWRRDGYDRNYPDYTAKPEFGPFVEAAHKLGFRVMAHVNHFGCHIQNPLFDKLKQYQLKDPFTKEPLGWTSSDKSQCFAYINPASKLWRQIFVSKMVELVKNYKVDALYIDQTLIIINDANGPIDGMSSIEGNIALHKELRKALPNVALGGEGLNEVTCKYESFTKRHEWGIDLHEGTWDDKRLAQAHAISSSLLWPYTTMYGYAALPNPESNPGLYMAWRRAYEHYGVIPTLHEPSVNQLITLPMMTAQLLDEARFFQKYQPAADFNPNWLPDSLFKYKLNDGRRAFYCNNNGVEFCVSSSDGKDISVMSKRISGVHEVNGSGSIPGWLIYNADRVFGLDPAQSYPWSKIPRDMNAFHIESMPANTISIDEYGVHPEFIRLKLDDPARTIRLVTRNESAESGVKFYDGRERRFPGIDMNDLSGAVARSDSRGISVHPPWRTNDIQESIDPKSLGDTFIEFKLRLPIADRITFETGVSMAPNVVGVSDGVLFRAYATCDGKTISSMIHNQTAVIEPLRLDLSKFAGRDIMLRLEANPGPANSVESDQSRFTQPIIQIDSSSRGNIELVSDKPFTQVLAANGTVEIKHAGINRYNLELDLPNTIIIPLEKETVVESPFNLLEAPHTCYSLVGQGNESLPVEFSSAIVKDAACLGDMRQALEEHPPFRGKTLVDHLLKLPSGPLHLKTAIGLSDRSESSGAAFEIHLNGSQLFYKELVPGTGWIPVDIDLSSWAGQTVMLTLITDSLGSNFDDWAVWANPVIVNQ